MKHDSSSLLFFLARTMPLSAACFLIVPTQVLAESTPPSSGAASITVDTIAVPVQSTSGGSATPASTSTPTPSVTPTPTPAPVVPVSTPTPVTTPVPVAPTVAPTPASPESSSQAIVSAPGTSSTVAPTAGSTAIAPVAPIQPSSVNPTGTPPYPIGYPTPVPYPMATPVPGSYPVSNPPVYYPVGTATQPTYPANPSTPGVSVQVFTSINGNPGTAYPGSNPAQVAYPPGYQPPATYPVTQPATAYPPGYYPQGTYPPGYSTQPIYPGGYPAQGIPGYPGQVATPSVPPQLPGVANPGYLQPAPIVPQPNGVQWVGNLSGDQALQKLAEADRLYRSGQVALAESIYRQVKSPLSAASSTPRAEAITNLALLPAEAQAAWRQATAAQRPDTQAVMTLKNLVRSYPQFLPGHLQLAQALEVNGRKDEAISVLEQAATLYPNQPDLVRTQVNALSQANRWMEASIAARQFALLNPNSSLSTEFTNLADQNLQRAQSSMKRKVTGNTIGSVLTGGLSYLLTGQLPVNATQNTWTMIQGESAVGTKLAQDLLSKVEVVRDADVANYVNEIGQKLARAAGRRDLNYEFYVVKDKDINATALPGGKIFVNAGAIANTHSEAEFAGLLAREVAHTALSHTFQVMAKENLNKNLTQLIPSGLSQLISKVGGNKGSNGLGSLTQLIPGALTQLIPNAGDILGGFLKSNYSSQMEQQADLLGTRLLAATGYAADGLRNLLAKRTAPQSQSSSGLNLSWLTGANGLTTSDRVRAIETAISQSGLNPYGYEGVERHAQVKTRVNQLLQQTWW